MFAETANDNDDYKKFSEQFGKCLKSCDHEIPQERIVEQITDVHVPQKGSFERTCEQSMDVPVPQTMGEVVEAFELIPQERMQNCAVTQTDIQNKQQLQDNQLQVAWQAARQERKKEREGRREENTNEREVIQKGKSKKVEKEEWEIVEEERKKEREREREKKCLGKKTVRLTRKDARESKERKGKRMGKKLKRVRTLRKKVRRTEKEREKGVREGTK